MTFQTFQSNHGPLALGDLSFAKALRYSIRQLTKKVVSPTGRYKSPMVVQGYTSCVQPVSEWP